MSKPCSICSHPKRTQIETEILNGTPYRVIEEWYGVGRSAIGRHKAEHLSTVLLKNTPPEVLANNEGIIDQLRDIHARTMRILREAEESGDGRTALVAIREARGNVELLSKLELVLADRAGHAKNVSPSRVVVFVSALGRDNGGMKTDLDMRVGDLREFVERRLAENKTVDLSEFSREDFEELVAACHLPLGDRVGFDYDVVAGAVDQSSPGGDVSINDGLSTQQGQNNPPPGMVGEEQPKTSTEGTNREQILDEADKAGVAQSHEEYLLMLKRRRMQYGVF